ncbi:Alpha-1,3-mannosyltransferase-like protein [Coelomomyces lativittatus]|nr:Alpha-1,3-mannosyltransferase-like protein [Coelomomyces lativittatus]
MVLSPKSIVFVHPDLGIGGAERLMVDMAVGLESQHHQVTIYTSHHSKTHCFPETLDLNVHVHGDTWLPRHVGGYFHIVFAILKQIYLCCVLVYQVKSGLQKVDVVFVDQLSIGIPILKWTSAKVVYYCHFPDQLLAKRSSRLRLFYRYLFDTLEAYTTSSFSSSTRTFFSQFLLSSFVIHFSFT